MTINFTGIKNVGYSNVGNHRIKCFNFQLTNDENGNDYDKYEKVLANTSDGDKYKKQNGPEFVTVDIDSEGGLMLNGEYVRHRKENIPLIKFLAKETGRVCRKRELVVDEGYIEGADLKEKSVFGKRTYSIARIVHDVMKIEFPDEVEPAEEIYKRYMEKAHEPDEVKDGAKKVNDYLSGLIYKIQNMK